MYIDIHGETTTKQIQQHRKTAFEAIFGMIRKEEKSELG